MDLPPSQSRLNADQPPFWPSALLISAVLAFFYLFVPRFGADHSFTTLAWLKSTWNPENDFEHGPIVPVICIALLVWQGKALREAASKHVRKKFETIGGLMVAALGALFFVAAFRTGQARLAVGGLPMILWGSSLFLWGWPVARISAFPLFLFWLAIPVPQFQQATTHLQILSTKLAGATCNLLGIEIYIKGTQIFSAGGAWEPLEIDEGCGGIRSLMALILISSVWAYLSQISLWKKAMLCLAAFPLAILGNTLRLTSIFFIAEHGDAEFARHTWHDWSGLLLFYPISLCLLLLLHSILEGGMPKFRRPTKVTRTTTSQPDSETTAEAP